MGTKPTPVEGAISGKRPSGVEDGDDGIEVEYIREKEGGNRNNEKN